VPGNTKSRSREKIYRKLAILFLVFLFSLGLSPECSIESTYASSYAVPNALNTDYLIIVENDSLSKPVQSLVNLRKSQGLNVNIVNAENIYKTYQGRDNADKIRNFLKDKYRVWNLKYLLLVGNENNLPYKMLYPSYNRSDSDTVVGRIPSNLYYSDLSSDFDSDKDNFPGEYINDKGIDFSTELMVGRIPFSSANEVYNTVNNIINFERIERTKLALFSGAILSYESEEVSAKKRAERTDGATLLDALYKDFLKPNRYNVKRMFEKSGIAPSLYSSDYPLKKVNFENLLKTDDYDLVIWNGHGNSNALLTKIWTEDKNKNKIPDKNEITFSTVLDLNSFNSMGNKRKGIFLTGSCSSIKPEEENIGKAALKSGFVGFIGGTRINWYAEDWRNINDGGNQTLLYFVVRNLILRNNTIGEALYSAIEEYGTSYRIFGDKDYQNLYSFNLYGDPALRLNSRAFNDIYVSVDDEDKTINLGEDLEYVFDINTEGGEDLSIMLSAIDYKKDLFTPFFYPNTINTQGTVRLKIIMAQNVFPTNYCMTIMIKTNTKNSFKILRFLILPWEKGPQIYLSYLHYNVGRNIELSIDLCLKDIVNVDTVYVEMTFDPSIITANTKSIIIGEFLKRDGILPIKQINSISAGTIGVYCTRGKFKSGISGGGIVFTVNFRTIKEGFTDVKLTRFFIFDPIGNQINAKKFDSRITVSNTGLFINKNISSGEITSKQFLSLSGTVNGETLWIGDERGEYLSEISGGGKYNETFKLREWRNSLVFITQRENSEFTKVRGEIFTNGIVSISLKIGISVATVNEKEVFLDIPPILENGRTLVPIRFISESIGAVVYWNERDSSITISLGDKKIYLWIGKREAIIERKGTKTGYLLDVPPKIINKRTVVPLRFVMEAFSAVVDWVSDYKLIKINYYK